MATPRRDVYLWVTWLTALLAGDAQCWYSPWVRAHFKTDPIPRGDFDLAAWKVQHAEMVDARAGALRADGWTVTVEDQNNFTLVGRVAKLGGKPDIVALKDGQGLVVDCKSGARRDSDVQQVLLYLFALPLASARYRDIPLAGEVQYLDGSIPIRPEQFTDALRQRIVEAITRIGRSDVPTTVPSARECAFCNVSKTDCPSRIETVTQPAFTEVF